jgi:hypothetical protein
VTFNWSRRNDLLAAQSDGEIVITKGEGKILDLLLTITIKLSMIWSVEEFIRSTFLEELRPTVFTVSVAEEHPSRPMDCKICADEISQIPKFTSNATVSLWV